MATNVWQTRRISVANLHLDPKNPRLGRETRARAPREILQYLFEHDKAGEVAESIAICGYFPNEPLLAVREGDRLIVVEGNRRLAALKALREPGLLEGGRRTHVEKLSRRMLDTGIIAEVPVTIAPDRRSTDRQIASRHVGTAVLPWQAENRASFILDKLGEGYTNEELEDDLGFTLADIQKARQTRAIAEMARSLDLPEEMKAKLDSPRANVFTTLERVFDSSVGREYLKVVPDSDHGIRGTTSKTEFVKGFTKLVRDVALGKQSSRTLNTNKDIQKYFDGWNPDERPAKKRAAFVPSDIIRGKSVASPTEKADDEERPKKSRQESKAVLPRDLHVRVKDDRLIDIRRELIKLKREDFPNAGAVLLRVFFELSVLSYLRRTGELQKLIGKLGGKGKLPYDTPTMRQTVPTVVEIAKAKLSASDANKVEKALRYDAAAPFTLSDLHAFVHQSSDLPGPRDIWQFWLRTEPLFRLMLEQETP